VALKRAKMCCISVSNSPGEICWDMEYSCLMDCTERAILTDRTTATDSVGSAPGTRYFAKVILH
jgi:hypothetical protein